MIKFIKEIFSSENLKKAMLYISFNNINNTTDECSYLIEAIKKIENTGNYINDIDNEEIQISKAS